MKPFLNVQSGEAGGSDFSRRAFLIGSAATGLVLLKSRSG